MADRTRRAFGVRRLLRSPRTAAWLFGLLMAWMVFATAVPQGALTDQDVSEWRETYRALAPIVAGVGLHRAFIAPAFLVLVALLAGSTAVCAWDRTRMALGAWRALGVVDSGLIARLERSPAFAVEQGASGADGQPLERASEALGRLGLRVRSGPRLLEARTGIWARFASPVFHWSLVSLFVVIPLGQLTIASGLMGVPVGGAVLDEPSAYGLLDRGPWNRELSGLVVAVEELPLTFEAGGVDRGAAPLVTLTTPEGREVARGHVYPNNPLREGSLVVHMSDYGLALDVGLRDGDQPVAQTEVLVDFDDAAPGGTTTAVLGIGDPDGEEDLVEIRLSVPLDRTDDGLVYRNIPREPVVRAEVVDLRTGETSSAMLAPGEAVETPVGELAIDRLDYYARLSLVDDWSIPFIYALFTIASLAVAASLLVPSRVVWVLRAGEPGNERLHVAVRVGRGDRGFHESVHASLAEEFGTVPAAVRTARDEGDQEER